jgi:hypothetical protein
MTTANLLEDDPVFLQELAPLLGYVPVEADVATLLRPLMLQTFKGP